MIIYIMKKDNELESPYIINEDREIQKESKKSKMFTSEDNL